MIEKKLKIWLKTCQTNFFFFSKWLVSKEPDGKEKVKEKEKVKIMELVAKELANPERDCKKFDPGRVAYRE
jgi:hypothetical protein